MQPSRQRAVGYVSLQQLAVSSLSLIASDSIPSERRGEVIAYVNRCSKQRGQGDRVGVVTFGNAANTEVFLIPEQFRIPDRFENPVTTTASDIGSGIERAISMLDSHGHRRIVLITDGNETRGDALAAAAQAVEKGIDIDLIPIRFEKHDAVVQAAVSPATVSIGEAFEINIAAQSTSDLSPGQGVLRVDVHSAHGVKTIDRRPVSLTTDLQTFSLQHRFDGIEDVGEVEATFLPAATSRDDVPWNSTAAIPGRPEISSKRPRTRSSRALRANQQYLSTFATHCTANIRSARRFSVANESAFPTTAL